MVISADDYEINSNTKSGIVYEANDINSIFEKIRDFIYECYSILEESGFNANALQNQTPLNIMILGLESFKAKLSDENKGSVNDVFTKAKEIGIINLVVVDSIENIKKSEFEPWFKDGFNANDGIWVGNGINDQFTFKTLVRTPEIKENISDDFAFVLIKGRPYLVKYVSSYELPTDEEFIEL